MTRGLPTGRQPGYRDKQQITVYFEEPERRRLERFVKARAMNMSQFVRLLVLKAIEKQGG
jgi:hypothetical protein